MMGGIDDSELEVIYLSPTCTMCKHLHTENYSHRTCDAFPDGIPDKIWKGDHNHLRSFPRDHGIRFESVN